MESIEELSEAVWELKQELIRLRQELALNQTNTDDLNSQMKKLERVLEDDLK